jgi:hypothetical protein
MAFIIFFFFSGSEQKEYNSGKRAFLRREVSLGKGQIGKQV